MVGMMRYIYRITKTFSFGLKAEKLALICNMIVWFLVGAIIIAGFGRLGGIRAEEMKSYAAAAGASLSLIAGYIGGMLWLVNQD